MRNSLNKKVKQSFVLRLLIGVLVQINLLSVITLFILVAPTVKIVNNYFDFTLLIEINNAGNSTRFVKVAVTSVRDVSQPKAMVPPNRLKQKMTKPAISTNEV
jgi:hypothetical protein